MACHETKNCPRCSAAFECKPGNITQCQCYGIIFSETEKDYVRDTYTDCLCRKCLDAMKHEVRHKETEQTLQSIMGVFKRG